MNDKIKFLLIGVIVGGLGVWIIMKSMPASKPDGNIQMMGASMRGNIDAHFIEQMIPHHDDAIAMAKLAQTRATHPEIKQLAENIIKSQSAENALMRQWYKNWFGRELPQGDQVMMHHGMMSTQADMDKLENASGFDLVFIEEMIPHHQMAVMMASMLKGGSGREEMKKLADDIITAQTSEIDQMKKWQEEWK